MPAVRRGSASVRAVHVDAVRLLPRAGVGGHGALVEVEAIGSICLIYLIPVWANASGFARAVLVAAKLAVLLVAFLQFTDFARFSAVVLNLRAVFRVFAQELVSSAVVIWVVFAAKVAAF